MLGPRETICSRSNTCLSLLLTLSPGTELNRVNRTDFSAVPAVGAIDFRWTSLGKTCATARVAVVARWRLEIFHERHPAQELQQTTSRTQIPAPEMGDDHGQRKAAENKGRSRKPQPIGVLERQVHGVEEVSCPDGNGPPRIVQQKEKNQTGNDNRVLAHRLDGSFAFASQQGQFAQKLRNQAAGTAPSTERSAKNETRNEQADPNRQPELSSRALQHGTIGTAHVRNGKRASEDAVKRELTQ
jgi:hypothetical protein